MIHLPHRQLLRAHRFVLEIHATTTLEELKRLVPNGLSRLIASERASINELAATRVVPSPVPFWWPRLGQLYQQHVIDHPLWQDRSRMHRVVGFDDSGLSSVWKNSLLNQEYFVPLGIRHQISSLVYKQESNYIGLAANRCSRDFGTADRLMLELLSPHIGRAWHNTVALAAVQRRTRETTVTHACGRTSVVLVDPRGGVIRDLSSEAAWILQKYFGRDSDDHGRLPCDLNRWLHAQLKRLSDQSEFTNEIPAPWCVQNDRGTLTMRLVRRTAEEAIVLLSDHASIPFGPPTRLQVGGRRSRPALSCTDREREILRWLREGKSNGEIAVILGISTRTVGKHLEHLFAKLGVENRTAAVRAASDFDHSNALSYHPMTAYD